MIKELILKNRSYRKFYQNKIIKVETMRELVDLARLSPAGGNIQGLRYILSNTSEENNKVFNNIFWARYYKDWDGPEEGEKPSAYMIILKDKTFSGTSQYDAGIAVQSILLGAVEQGLGGCIIGCVDRKNLSEAIKLDEKYEILLVLALGYPKEQIVIEEAKPDGDIKYWRDENQVHHVPKRSLKEIIL